MRILLTFLMDPGARPTPRDMKLWVDCVRFIKRGAKGGALGFFTYMELSAYFCPCYVRELIYGTYSHMACPVPCLAS